MLCFINVNCGVYWIGSVFYCVDCVVLGVVDGWFGVVYVFFFSVRRWGFVVEWVCWWSENMVIVLDWVCGFVNVDW